jgi:hypothetical protein
MKKAASRQYTTKIVTPSRAGWILFKLPSRAFLSAPSIHSSGAGASLRFRRLIDPQ